MISRVWIGWCRDGCLIQDLPWRSGRSDVGMALGARDCGFIAENLRQGDRSRRALFVCDAPFVLVQNRVDTHYRLVKEFFDRATSTLSTRCPGESVRGRHSSRDAVVLIDEITMLAFAAPIVGRMRVSDAHLPSAASGFTSAPSRCDAALVASRHGRSLQSHHVRHASRVLRAVASGAQNLEQAWTELASEMKATNEVPSVERWNMLFNTALETDADPAQAIWVLDRMKETGAKPTAASYESLMQVCLKKEDKAAAFLLVEKMWEDKILLGDIEFPPDMEKTLRAILPPEAFD